MFSRAPPRSKLELVRLCTGQKFLKGLFLSDPARTIQEATGVPEYTDPEHDPTISHTRVLKPGLAIHSIYNGYWLWRRPSCYDL